MSREAAIAVVIPSFRVRRQILSVIEGLGPEVRTIYVVDDACPEGSGDFVQAHCRDPRVRVIWLAENQGVGGAVMAGYGAALADGHDIVVKVDGDGQMDGALLPRLVSPILEGRADYTKGNRFFDLDALGSMPRVRLIGNAILSFVTKFSSGYWGIFDPTNGFTAIHRDVARHLDFGKISRRYFFETDILFRLNTLRAVVVDVPMAARYGDEVSNLRIRKILPEFAMKHARNAMKRIFYNYYLRDMSIASVELPVGLLMVLFGTVFGFYHWFGAGQVAIASAGTVMLSALPVIVGIQLLLAFLNFDIGAVPGQPVQLTGLDGRRGLPGRSEARPSRETRGVRREVVMLMAGPGGNGRSEVHEQGSDDVEPVRPGGAA